MRLRDSRISDEEDAMRRMMCIWVTPFAILGAAAVACADSLYWTDLANFVSGKGDIRRSNLDGSAPTPIVSDLTGANSVTFDLIDGKMYFTAGGNPSTNLGGSIQRANLDGNGQQVLKSNPFFPVSVALDVPNNSMYWIQH